MAYAYYIINETNNTYLVPETSQSTNTYVNFTFKSTLTPSDMEEAVWVTNKNPLSTTNNFSSDLIFFNPFHNIFLGNAEQPQSLMSPNQNVNGTIAGSFNFTASKDANTFVTRTTGSAYHIYLKPNTEDDNTTLKNSIITDGNNSGKIVIADFDHTPSSYTTNNSWIFTSVL